ncbi:Cellulose synthase catalytic subunit [Alkalibacterium sp. AK22]|uniref:glycosyltransferase family 2 protein n=1 Tax=Alkalibacterium sp. AK22 TaxID=1229520 RepID=UPI0004468210|nr:glycosyltransferase family 2 protein [Alkalibacterium sp. AK22]EXJ23769.1 Cellulose synthase catalytic subunit [Alkalibacterium sp. AK22]
MEKVPRRKKLIYLAAFIFSGIYLTWRGLYTLPINETLFALVFGVLLWLSEIVSNFTAIILIWSRNKAKEIELPVIADEDYPHIDVLIATHNEEPELLRKTVNACTRMTYPDSAKVHIYISDDQSRKEIKALAESFNVGYIGLTGNKHAKSGNLNNALNQTASPLVATFDADMIPYSNFLLETVPYFVENAAQIKEGESVKPLGLVQTPQSFYNADLFQYNLFSEKSIPNEQDFFSREVNLMNNAHDAAVYTGSNTVISRQAIEDAGGFPTDTITEDFELGALINTAGYKNISTKEPMASGLTPTDIPSVLKQRIRWARGVVQSVHNLNLLFNRKLSTAQKLVYLNGYLYWWSFFRRIMYILAPILFTVFSVRVVDTSFWILLVMWLPSYFFLHLSMQDISSMIRTQRWGEVQETIFAPYLILPVFLQTIGFKETTFKVTNKNATQSRRDLLFIIPHLILWILALYGLVSFNWGKYGSEMMYGSIISFWLLTHLFNLTFAILFYLNRPYYRKQERFPRKVPVKIESSSRTLDLFTHDLSENGLSFKSDYPYYFEPDEELNITIEQAPYRSTFTGKLVRVFKQDDHWVYGLETCEIEDEDELNYLQIIYDGFNEYLPMFYDKWVTHIDRLVENVQRRVSKNKTGPLPVSLYPEIQSGLPVQCQGKDYRLLSFDYHTITLDRPLAFEGKQNLTAYCDGFKLELSDSLSTASHATTYKINNLNQLKTSGALNTLVSRMMKGDSLHGTHTVEV